jgi:hypothetical protein
VLSDLLAVTLNDNVREAADWASESVRPRACALAEHAGVEEQVDELVRAILRLKQRASLAATVKDARTRQQHTSAAHGVDDSEMVDAIATRTVAHTSQNEAGSASFSTEASDVSHAGAEVTLQLSHTDAGGGQQAARRRPAATDFNTTTSSVGSDY